MKIDKQAIRKVIDSLEVGDLFTFRSGFPPLFKGREWILANPEQALLLKKNRNRLLFGTFFQNRSASGVLIEERDISEIARIKKDGTVPVRIIGKRVNLYSKFAAFHKGRLWISDGDQSQDFPAQELFELMAEGLGYDLQG